MDAKSLLRAKKAEARIEHPYASYTSSGQLRCTVCAQPVVKWDAHILTKQHRQSVQREKEAQAAAAAKAKRKLAAVEAKESATQSDNGAGNGKRVKIDALKRLPEGFFSAENQPAAFDDDENDDEGEHGLEQSQASTSTNTVPASVMGPTGDTELDDFFASLAEDTPQPPTQTTAPTTTGAGVMRKKTTAYKEVIPGVASYEAAPVRIIPEGEGGSGAGQEGGDGEEEESKESEAERKERLEREEREEIMRRLEEEERAQEDADSRVTALKKRMEMLRKQRQARAGKA